MANKSINWSISLRPTKLKDVYGLDKLKTFAYKAAKKNEWPEAMLLQAKYGTGKTTAAKILAQMMVCQHPDADGEPCCECPSCKAIVDETWSRDVINLDGAKDKSEDIMEKLDAFTATAPFKDKTKVVILDEMQALSAQCKSKLLKLLESKRGNVHYIFTSMVDESSNSKMAEASIKALTSRLMTFKYPQFGEIDIMKYLYSIIKKLNIEAPIEFKTYGLQLIAQNCDGSLRRATMILQQCVETETFDLEGIKQSFGLANVEDFYQTLLRLLNGETSKELFETLVNVNDYDGHIRLSVLAFANAETYRLFGTINEYNGNGKKVDDKLECELIDLFSRVNAQKDAAKTMSDWQKNKTIADLEPLIKHPNYFKVRDMFADFYKDNSVYTTKASYILGMTRIIDACRNNKSTKMVEQTAPQPTPQSAVLKYAAADEGPLPQPATVGRRIIRS